MKQPPPDVALIPEGHCLECGTRLNAIGTRDGSVAGPPEPGSIIVCPKCGAVLILGDDLKPRAFTDEEADALCADHDAMKDLAHIVRDVHIFRHSQN